jgi:hypothetical protein
LTLALNYSEIKKHIDIFISPFNIVLDILIAIFVYFLMSTLVKLLPDDLNTLKNILVIAFSFGLTFIINIFFTKKSETA